jgi:hypothetical protein
MLFGGEERGRGRGMFVSERPSVAGGKAALKDARFPQFAVQIGSPAPRFAAPSASLTAAPPPAPGAPSSIGKTVKGDGK